jgi:hypothetical protein
MTEFKTGGIGTLAVKRRKRALYAESLPVYRLTRDINKSLYGCREERKGSCMILLHFILNKRRGQNCWVFGLCPSSGILETRKHNVSETRSQ